MANILMDQQKKSVISQPGSRSRFKSWGLDEGSPDGCKEGRKGLSSVYRVGESEKGLAAQVHGTAYYRYFSSESCQD